MTFLNLTYTYIGGLVPTYLHVMANLQPSTMQCTTTMWNLSGKFLGNFLWPHCNGSSSDISAILFRAYRG